MYWSTSLVVWKQRSRGSPTTRRMDGSETMSSREPTVLPRFETVSLTRKGHLLTITLQRPNVLNAVNEQMHKDLIDVLAFVDANEQSNVLVLTNADRAFSTGGDHTYIAENAKFPERFDVNVQRAKRIVYALL